MEIEYNLADNQRAERKLLVTYVNVGASSSSPEWEAVGVRVEESSIEFNPDVSTLTDILGITYTDVNKTEPQQSFDPFTVRGGSKLHQKLEDIMQRNALTELGMFDVMIVRGYIGDGTDGYNAEKHSNCTIVVNSLGGSTNVDMPIEIHYSNNKTLGTVNALTGSTITFTED